MQKSHFLLLKKFKNTASAQLCTVALDEQNRLNKSSVSLETSLETMVKCCVVLLQGPTVCTTEYTTECATTYDVHEVGIVADNRSVVCSVSPLFYVLQGHFWPPN